MTRPGHWLIRTGTTGVVTMVALVAAACGGSAANAPEAADANAAQAEDDNAAQAADDNAAQAADGPAPTVEVATPEPEPTVSVGPTPRPTNPTAPTPSSPTHPILDRTACVLRLHGNNGSGGLDADSMVNGPYYAGGQITLLDPLSPTITEQNTWWEFDGPYGVYSETEAAYTALAQFLEDHVDRFDCGPILVWGLSGGGAMAVELYCNGEDFDGRVWGYYFADPPMGESVLGCSPPTDPTVRTWLVQSNEFINAATAYTTEGDGTCPVGEWGWYCEDGAAMTPERWRAELGIEPVAVVDAHLEALLGGTPTEVNMWDQVENWYRDYSPSRFS